VADGAEHPDHVDADAIELPQLGKGLHPRAYPQPRARLRRLEHAATADQLVAEDATEHPDDVDANAIKLPRLGKGLHPRAQPRPRLRGHAVDNRGAMERLVAAAGVEWFDAAAGVEWFDAAAGMEWFDAAARFRGLDAAPAQRLSDADAYPPGPQRTVDSASTPAVLPAAAADLAPHRSIRRPHQPAGWLLPPGPGSAAAAAAERLRLEQRTRPRRTPAELGRPATFRWLGRADAACRWLEPTVARAPGRPVLRTELLRTVHLQQLHGPSGLQRRLRGFWLLVLRCLGPAVLSASAVDRGRPKRVPPIQHGSARMHAKQS
jgi:hypothetical protein